jgi:hypothetical protein
MIDTATIVEIVGIARKRSIVRTQVLRVNRSIAFGLCHHGHDQGIHFFNRYIMNCQEFDLPSLDSEIVEKNICTERYFIICYRLALD